MKSDRGGRAGQNPGRDGRGAWPWLVAIVVAAAVLRFYPIWFGLPYLRARPDEETAVGRAIAILGGDLNPHFFHWPSLTLYLFAALFRVTSWIRNAAALDPELSIAGYTLLARGLVALAGTATVGVVYAISRRIADAATGLLAALFLAVAILHVRESHFAMTDVLMTFFTTASIAILLRAVDRWNGASSSGALRLFATAGLVAGLAASTKYSGAAVVAAMAVAQLFLARTSLTRRTWAPSFWYSLAFGAGFLIGTPYAVLDFAAFRSGLTFTVTHLSGGHGVDVGQGWSYHLTRSLPYGVGIPTFVAALAGAIPFARRYPRSAAIVAAFPLVLYASLASGYTVFFRYILPIVPFVCLAAAIGVRHLGQWSASRVGTQERVVTAAIVALVAMPSFVNSVWFDVLLAKTDTRVLAARWLETQLTPDSSLHDAGHSYSTLDLHHLRFHDWYFDPVTGSFGHPEGQTPDWLVFHESPLRLYAGVPPALRQLASAKYTLVQTFVGTRGGTRTSVYDQQDAFFMPLSGFRVVERPGPTISIYRRAGQ